MYFARSKPPLFPQASVHGIKLTDLYSIPAVFYFELTSENTVIRFQTVILPGNPLDLATLSRDGTVRHVVVALDTSEAEDPSSATAKRLLTLDWDNHALVLQPVFTFLDAEQDAAEPDTDPVEIRKLFYTVEALRKREFAEEDGVEQDVVATAEAEVEAEAVAGAAVEAKPETDAQASVEVDMEAGH